MLNADINSKKVIDDFETSILYLLEGKNHVEKKIDFLHKTKDFGMIAESADTFYNKFIKTRKPINPLLFCNIHDESSKYARLFTTDPNLLLQPVHEIIGKSAEIALLSGDGNHIKWHFMKKIDQLPKRLFTNAPSDKIYYESHYKYISSTLNDYTMKIFAWSPKYNKIYPVVNDSSQITYIMRDESNSNDLATMFLTASMIEDSRCYYFFKVTISCIISITIYTFPQAILELFKLRKNPLTSSGRRRPLLHWVYKHLRRKPYKFEKIEIPDYLRGINEFEFDGFHIKIQSPD